MVFKCRICLSYPTKEQSSSAPPVLNKDLLKTFFCKPSRPNACFMAVSNFSARKKNYLKPDTSGSIFPTPRRQRSNSPLPGEQKFVKCPGGGEDLEVSI